MLSLENDVGPFLAMCVATQHYGDVHIKFKGREGIVMVIDEVEMRRPEEIVLRTRRMAGPRPQDRIMFSICPALSFAILPGVSALANSLGTTWFTRLSVHWADNITATSSPGALMTLVKSR